MCVILFVRCSDELSPTHFSPFCLPAYNMKWSIFTALSGKWSVLHLCIHIPIHLHKHTKAYPCTHTTIHTLGYERNGHLTPHPETWHLRLTGITGATMLWCQKSYPWYKYKYCHPFLMPSLALCWLSPCFPVWMLGRSVDSQYWPVLKSGGFQMLKILYNQY